MAGISAWGTGTVVDKVSTFQFQVVDGTTGEGSLSIVDDNTMEGTITNDAVGPREYSLRR